MAGHRSTTTLPLRLQQILSGGRSSSPTIKLESEPPPKVKSFIDRVIKSPLHDIAIPLSGFRWEYNKGNFHHWRPLFMHFDTYIKTYISSRKDLLLADDFSEEEPFPKHSVMQILRVMQIILENCHNKGSFGGLEHFKLLLASTDPEILIATLETLCALVKINPAKMHLNGKSVGFGSMNSYLLSLAQGWGSKEEGLGLHSCIVANERTQDEGLCLFPSDTEDKTNGIQYRLGSTLFFECNFATSHCSEQVGEKDKISNLCVIKIPDLHLRKEDDIGILKQCIDQYNVPSEHRFSLLTRIRYARAFRSPRTCRFYSKISILAFIALVQSSDAHDELVSFFANEPEYTNELIRLVRSEDSVPVTIRALAMLALGAQLAAYASSHERARILSGSSIISAGGNRMVLLSVLQKAIFSLSNPSDPSTPLLVDALLQFFLLHVLSSSSSGSAIRGSGMVPPLLPLLQDTDPSHMHLVCSAVKVLQKLMEYSSPAVSLFKDLGGVDLLAQRLQVEVHRVIGTADENTSTMITSDLSKCDEDNLYSQKKLIKALLKALGSATYSPANSMRSQNSHDGSLPASLSLIFRNVIRFGGDIYFSAVTVMSEIIHRDPTCYALLDEMGLPESFLSSVVSGVLPSAKALICVPNGLGAICLNAKGLEAVKETAALRFLVDIFTTRKYLLAINEGVVLLANAVEELLRHVQTLKGTGVDIIVEIINKLATIGEEDIKETSVKPDENVVVMEMDLEDKASEGRDLVSTMDSAADGMNDEQFLQLCVFHAMVLVHRTMENSETCRLFVEKGGIEALLKLLLRPVITQPSDGMSIALHSAMVFKSFTQHHSAPLARAFSSSLREQLRKALSGLSSAGDSVLLAPKRADEGIFSSLFVIEFLLFLAASKDSRWIGALLTEFGDPSKDVLQDIGNVHREVLWQLALLEDSRVEVDTDSSSASRTQAVDSAMGESDDQRVSSFRQHFDLFPRRRMSGWNVESQYSELIRFYFDLGRAASGSQGLGIDGLSTLRLASSSQSVSSNSSDATGSSKGDEDKQRSFTTSCREMMRSLSHHINHLFVELGKAMVHPRRENIPVNLPPSSISVVNTAASIVLEHLNFVGHANSSDIEVPISKKCRYLGKVIDFIDGILFDRPESCNPITLNCFYGRGVIQAILTTFEATSQLLFAVNKGPNSPMETDDKSHKEENEEMENFWLYGPLASYGMLMDHLATSSYILSSSTKQLLEQPIASGDVTFPRDGEAFMKMLQSKVLKAVLPIWANPHFVECNMEFISTMISIIKHVYSGVEVRNASGSSGTRLAGPPPDESTITLIVDMGFSRARAEEALRQVGTNSVEIATDWLFSHPEEPQEDAELARALAMSLGNSDSKEDEPATVSNIDQEEEFVQLPPIDDILSTCMRLLQAKESLAFPVRDLLVMISTQNDGQNRAKVLSYLIDLAKQCGMPSDVLKESMLSALFHVLALILHEDTKSREVASEAGLVKLCLDMLSSWNLGIVIGDKPQVPKWVTACFLSIERMFHVDPKLAPDSANVEHLKRHFLNTQSSVIIEENKKDPEPVSGFLDIQDQKRLIEICCRCIRDQLPSEVMHVVLQLSSTLTKVHSLAVRFLDNGGFHALLNLPTTSLFSGFNNIAAVIIRHILEDPNTLQQAMELEIRHSIVTATSRHSNPGVTPRNFVQNLAAVISRDPVVFVKAAQNVCQVEMFGGRPYIVLLKDREKDKSKEKDKEKTSESDKLPASDVKGSTGDATPTIPFSHSKQVDLSTKISKTHRKSPQSFTNVIEHLLDMIASFLPPSTDDKRDEAPGNTASADMDVDSISKGKGKAIALSSEDSKASSQDSSASLAKTAFILKLLTEILLTYASSIHVLLRRDAELSSFRGPPRVSSGSSGGGIFYHILHKFLPYPGMPKKDKKADGDWRYKLATRANQFLVAAAIRSSEGRRRIFTEINNVFSDFNDSASGCKAPTSNMHAFVDLLNEVLAGRSPTGSYILAEASVTYVDVGLVRSLTRTLQVLDLDNADSPKVVTAIVKALESVTKEYVHSSDVNSKGNDSSNIVSDHNQVDSSSNGGGDRFQVAETMSQPDHNELVVDHMDSFNTVPNSGSSDFVADDMDHDRDLDGGFNREAEDDFMHEASEDGAGLENGISTVDIRFDMPRGAEDDIGEEDDDEDMSGDDGEEVEEDEDDEEHNDLEEDEVHQMSHPDTDHDDHEIDDEEFDEDVLEDDDEDDDDDGVILRVEEGFSGFNVLDQIEVLGGNNLPNDTLRVMPIDIFGSRRQGRTSSIYNILGRAGEFGVRLEHPLLEEPSSLRHIVQQRQSENTIEVAFSDRNHENTSRVDTFFRTLRSGRHGHRFSMWSDDTLQRGGSSSSAVPQGIEDLLVSHLRRPASDQPPEQNISTAQPQEPNLTEQLQGAETEARESGPAGVAEATENMIIPSPVINTAGDSGVRSDGASDGEPHQERGISSASEQVTEMQYERSDATARDVEAVSQASSGSGATLGESLRSLEVEIGSVDGHDDGDRQGPGDRLPLTDIQPAARARRSPGVALPVSNRDISLESVNENPQHQSQEGDPSAALNEEQQAGQNVESESIDPTFLEALPEDLRAEVLSSRQNQVTQPPGERSNEDEEIDPEFLAALPSDIREEVLAQQRAQRLQQSQELEGQPVEMDAVSIIATFPSDIREEVLLTSSDALLSTLTPALVAEANMLRERFAHRYHSGSLFGVNSRSRRGETSRRGDILGTSLDRNIGDVASRRSGAGNLIEADGIPLVDSDALKALIRLLRVVQPLYKGQLQRLLLNLCAHQETRMSLVKILMDILMLDLRGSPESIMDGTESPFRLYGCQSYITYSRPQLSDGVPPLVSRRVLETLTYLARNHPNLSKLLLHLELPRQPVHMSKSTYQGRGKAVMMEEDMPESKKGVYAIVILLSLLNQPLYVRSVAHLEQLLNLLEVIMINAENDSSMTKKSRTVSEQPSGNGNTAQDSQMDANMVGSAPDGNSKSPLGEGSDKSLASVGNAESSVRAVLLNLPEADLRLLCSLLAREGLSDSAYVLVAEVLKKMVASAPNYCSLFITELAASVRNLVHSAMNELHLYENEKSLLSSSSTTGTAILRVLQALSSLVSSLHEKKDNELPQEKDFADALSKVWEINAALESLWVELSNCISKIESSSETPSESVSVSGNSATSTTSLAAPLPAGTQNFLPYIESFFVTCEKLHPEQNEPAQDLSAMTNLETEDAAASTSGQKSGANTNADEKNAAFIRFSEKHKKLLNAFIRQNPGLLEKSFYLMLKVPRFIDFDNKRAHFRSKIKHQHDHHHSPVRISVRRAYILEDSYNQLRMRSHQELKGRLTVHFQGEEGIDAGGLTREWYQLLSRVIFDKGALLFTTVGNESTFQPNPNSVYQTEHLSYFKFVGRVVGKALFDGQLLDVHFTRSFYKHILGVKVTYHDIEAIDPDYYKNLKWLLENDISDVLDLTFSMDADEEKLILYERTEVTDCELIPGGRNIRVTEENKHEYVDRVAEHRLTTAIRPQINAFLEGFNELIPRDLISIFNDKEFELLISGLPDIDLDDLRANTEYSGYTNASPVIQWFWEVVQSFSKEDKARFLQFVTGTSKVPLEGFSALQGISGIQKFQIHKAYGSTDHLPSAHTCFNQLDLPEYASKEQLEQRLLLAIHEGNEGFGFG